MASSSGLSRSLGFPMLVFYGVGMILGAGIYSIIGKAAQQTGESLWLGFAMAGVAAMMTALSYAELSTLFPKAGAEFVYLGAAFDRKKWIAATVGIAMALSGAATAAAVAMAFAGYLNSFFEVQESLVAVLVLLSFTGVAVIGIRTSGWFTVVSTLIEVGGLIFIIYLGTRSEKFMETLSVSPTLGTLSGMALIIFSFFGFENIANLAEESKKPQRDLPWAILLSVAIATTLYIFVSMSALALLSVESLAGSKAPLMDVAKSISAQAGKYMGIVALFSTANTALISMIGASRILYSMGRAGELSKVITRTIPNRKTPWIASIVIFIMATALLPLGRLETVAGVSSLATMIAFFSVNVALIVLRYKNPSMKRSFRVPFSVGRFPLIPFIAALICLFLMTQFEATVYLVGGVLLSVAAIIFILRK
ncbi:MAG: amino acid permease [Bdellovibrionaceae bacterium]|nr:amino acid permease [Pseudobdellovibrionaceae bacterium]